MRSSSGNNTGETGATSVEYSFLAALVAAVIFSTVWAVGGDVRDSFDIVAQRL